MQVNTLNYIIAALTALNTLRDLILASPPTASSSLGSLSCWWGDRHPLIAAKDECVQCKRRESVQRSTSLQLLNQSWQGSASTDMRCSEENVCVCMCESHTHTQHISIYKGVCVYVHSLGWEADERETVKACFSHSHSRACERSALSVKSTR